MVFFLSIGLLRTSHTVEPMEQLNQSQVSEFILLGLTSSRDIQFLLFALFSVLYVVTVLGNFLMVAVFYIPNLNTPMYFLVGNLSFMDMILASFVTPKVIVNLVKKHKTIFLCWMLHTDLFPSLSG